jgi:hypothetical protein
MLEPILNFGKGQPLNVLEAIVPKDIGKSAVPEQQFRNYTSNA